MVKIDFSRFKIKNNMVTKITVLGLCLFFGFILILPFFLDNSSLKFYLEEKVSEKLNGRFEINGNVSVGFLPSPRIVIKKAKFSNLESGTKRLIIDSKAIIIKPGLFSLFSNNLKIKTVDFESPKIELGSAATDKKDDNKLDIKNSTPSQVQLGFTGKIFNFHNSKTEIFNLENIDRFIVEDGSFVREDTRGQISLEFTTINFEAKNNSKKQTLEIAGKFLSDGMPTEFQVAIDGKKIDDSKVKIISPVLRFDFEGTFKGFNFDNLARTNLVGKLDADIIDLKAVLNKYISKDNLIFRKLNSTKPIKISAEIDGTDGEININNINIKSELISGSGRVESNFALNRPIIDIDIDLNNIDIDSLWLSAATANNKAVVDVESDIIKTFFKNNTPPDNDTTKSKVVDDDSKPEIDDSINLTQDDKDQINHFENIDLTAEISVKTAKYLEGELKDISLYFVLADQGQFLLQPLLVNVPGNGILRISGAFETENNVPKFIGKIDGSGKDLEKFLAWLNISSDSIKPGTLSYYTFTSDVLTLSNFIILDNLYASLNNGKNLILGDIKIDDSAGLSSVTSTIKISELNFDDYFIMPGQISYFSPGSLLKKVFWLNNIKASNQIDVNFGKFSYQNRDFTDLAAKISFGQGYFKFENAVLNSDDLSGKANFSITIADNNPTIDLAFNLDNFKYQSEIPKVADASDSTSSASIPADTATDAAPAPILSQIKSPALNFDKIFFDLPSFDGFVGTFNFKAKNLQINDFNAANVVIPGKMDDANLKIENASADIYKGKFKFNGAVVLKSAKSMSGSFELNAIDTSKFLDDILEINNSSGVMNVVGAGSSNGSNQKEFFENLTLQLKFIGGNIFVNGFGMDDLVRKMINPRNNIKELSKPEDVILNPNYKTFFKQVSGAVEIIRDNRSNKLRIETQSPGVNSVTTGSLDIGNNSFAGVSNFVFITGTVQNQIPLTVAIGTNGKFGNLQTSINVDQVNQYLRN